MRLGMDAHVYTCPATPWGELNTTSRDQSLGKVHPHKVHSRIFTIPRADAKNKKKCPEVLRDEFALSLRGNHQTRIL